MLCYDLISLLSILLLVVMVVENEGFPSLKSLILCIGFVFLILWILFPFFSRWSDLFSLCRHSV